MPDRRIYLDYNASAPLRPAARSAWLAATDRPANASSVHGEGRAARGLVEEARGRVAALVGAMPAAVTFTSGGSEANASLLADHWLRHGEPVFFDRLLVSAVEHPSVLKGGRFPADRIERFVVDGDGVVDLARLGERLDRARAAGERALVAVMAANNETGVVQPVRAIADLAHGCGAFLMVDGVQVFGRIPFDLGSSGADALTVSAHKIGGPHGVGAVIMADDSLGWPALVIGGGQERHRRAGTENVAGIAAFGAAAAEVQAESGDTGALLALRQDVERAVRDVAPAAVIFGEGVERLPNTVCFGVAGLVAETAVIGFDLAGIALSSGSACSSGKVAASHVLEAMAVPATIAKSALRVSLGWSSRAEDVSRFGQVWQDIYKRLRRQSAA